MKIIGSGRLLTSALIVLAGCATFVSISAGQSAENRLDHGSQRTERTPTAADIGALRHVGQPGVDRLPDHIIDTPLLSGASVDLGTARIVRRIGRPIWLASTSDGSAVCEITASALACPPIKEIASRGISPVLFSRAGEAIHVSGIAADSVASVDVVLADGTVERVPIVDNIFTLDVTSWPRGLRWEGPTGSASFDFPQVVG